MPSWARLASSCASATPTTCAISGQSSAGIPSSAEESSTTPGSDKQPREVDRPLVVTVQGLELIAITGQGHQVQAVIFGPARPVDPQVDLDRAAPDLFANELLEGGLDHRVRLADPGAQLEMPIVDGSHLDHDRSIADLEAGPLQIRSCSAARQPHNSKCPTRFWPDGPRIAGPTETGPRCDSELAVQQNWSAIAGPTEPAVEVCRPGCANASSSWVEWPATRAGPGGRTALSHRLGARCRRNWATWTLGPCRSRSFALDLEPLPGESASFDAANPESSQADAGLRLVRTTMSIESRIQAMATPTVTLVKTSPVRAPKALEPPIPPKAPASPPPLPRWIRMRMIRNRASG